MRKASSRFSNVDNLDGNAKDGSALNQRSFLGLEVYATALFKKRTLIPPPNKPPFSSGLKGEWGIGC